MSVVQNWILLGNRGQDCVSSLSFSQVWGEEKVNLLCDNIARTAKIQLDGW